MTAPSLKTSVVVAFMWGALTGPLAEAQSAGTARMEGRVTHIAGTPVPGVKITVISVGGERRTWGAQTGGDGTFAISSLPSGKFRVHVHHPNFLLARHSTDVQGLNGGTIQLTDGEVRRIAVVMMKGGVITGRTTSGTGAPLSDVNVHAYGVTADGALKQVSARSYASNDVGVYRIANLPPGRYFVAARYRPDGRAARDEGYAPTWYPGSILLSAAVEVEVRSDNELPAIDISLQSTRLVTVEGLIRGVSGQPLPGVQLRLTAAGNLPVVSQMTVRTDRDGTFRLRNVVPGDYIVEGTWARSTATRNPTDGAQIPELQVVAQPVRVEPTDKVLSLGEIHLAAAPRISGELAADGVLPPQLKLTVVAVPVGPGRSLTEAAAVLSADSRTFNVAVAPDAYTLRAHGLPSGWHLAGVEHRGSDVTNGAVAVGGADSTGWIVRLTRQSGSVTGTIAGAKAGASVILLAEDPRAWKETLQGILVTSTDNLGRFSISGVRAGRYHVVALPEFDHTQRYQRQLLDRLFQAGKPLNISAGEAKSVDMTFSSIR